SVPDQEKLISLEQAESFLKKHQSIVVKPADNEQGRGISVDIRTLEELKKALDWAKGYASEILLESYHPGQDLRVVVIQGEVVAASIRKIPQIVGDGQHSVKELLNYYNRRRLAATQGESSVPLDEETQRCLKRQALHLDSVLAKGQLVDLRKTANLHTGGTLHDVTKSLQAHLKKVSLKAAEILEIPVVGLDLMIKDPSQEDYVLIEANERVGLANHAPQPTAEKFIDFLFPQTIFKNKQGFRENHEETDY
ncbi:MAG: N-acetylglutaminylglutamine synthetase, partial [Deltaproteobacteria bacterium]|nr:N-acetylglutaminylglutamine synthetase [Deltaproteobacteria bacterium]